MLYIFAMYIYNVLLVALLIIIYLFFNSHSITHIHQLAILSAHIIFIGALPQIKKICGTSGKIISLK